MISEATTFIAAWYGSKMECDISCGSLRWPVPRVPLFRNWSCCPNTWCLSSACISHSSSSHDMEIQSDPTNLDLIPYGWQEGEGGVMVCPTTLPPEVAAASITILQLIMCRCTTSRPCSTGKCGCVPAQMSCPMFCSCNAGSDCCNEQTRAVTANQTGEDDKDWNYIVCNIVKYSICAVSSKVNMYPFIYV